MAWDVISSLDSPTSVNPEWVVIGLAFLANICALIWNASRVNSTVGQLTRSVACWTTRWTSWRSR
jgi:hypothetical protein